MSDEIVSVPIPTRKSFRNLLGSPPFGTWIVVAYAGVHGSPQPHAAWHCQCNSCGKMAVVQGFRLLGGDAKSCDCQHTRHLLSQHPLYSVWVGIRRRCEDETRLEFENYGKRGISVELVWQEFVPFYEWAIAHGYEDGLQLDRINTNGNYGPNNCLFVTISQNASNKRKGKSKTRETPDSQYIGVCFDRRKNRWKASGRLNNGKQKSIGLFSTEKEAAIARDAFYDMHRPGFFTRNFPITEQIETHEQPQPQPYQQAPSIQQQELPHET